MSAAGHPVAQEPYDAFFGSRYAIVIDPDGNQVGIKSPIEDDQRHVPREPSSGGGPVAVTGRQVTVVVCGNGPAHGRP